MGELEQALGRLLRKGRPSPRPLVDTAPGCAFGVIVGQRLQELEESLGEVKARLNGLIFLVVGAVLLEMVLRLMR